ncbi:MAG: ATP-binding cassette domain-containing protein [Candidatus Aminicenantes bacterium]|nr:ATP-binding cassette domain-containing protein [Candidatus Aminicenantes bacterium]
MALLSLQEVTIGFGGPLLLDKVNLQIEAGEKTVLLGRNGEGKTTLLRLLNGDITPDSGSVTRRQGSTTALLTQEIPAGITGKVYDIVSAGLGKNGALLARYHQVGSLLSEKEDKVLTAELDRLQQALEAADGWHAQRRVEDIISRMGLEPGAAFAELSAGLKRRTLLARALAGSPDVLLLDEPTNHMDIETIARLEDLLSEYSGTFVLVTHDRVLVQKLANRIIEIDRGKLSSWACDYRTFLERKGFLLEAEEVQWAKFDKKLAKEETWIRQGIKARRTRNEGRVRKLLGMREVRRRRREQVGAVRMQTQQSGLSGKVVIEAEKVNFAYDEKPLIRDFTCAIMRGDRVGIIGPNGSGKTTLLRILLAELAPLEGEVSHGTKLEVVYFDQLREQLEEKKTVKENIAGGNDYVTVGGSQRHVFGYLQDFLFTPERSRTKVEVLSGGERSRLLLARLFTRPANLLVLDEPTNDLDIETLELLEELLLEYNGTLLLVSHDRAFLNNVVTNTLALEGEGAVKEYIGGYDDWLRQGGSSAPAKKEKVAAIEEKERKKNARVRKLTYNEERELAALPRRIEEMEQEREQLFDDMANPEFFKRQGDEIAAARARLADLEKELAGAYERWEYLEEIKTPLS